MSEGELENTETEPLNNTLDTLDTLDSSDMLNKNTYYAKKGEANQKQQLSDYSSD